MRPSPKKVLTSLSLLALLAAGVMLWQALAPVRLEPQCYRLWRWGRAQVKLGALLSYARSPQPWQRYFAVQALGDFKLLPPGPQLQRDCALISALNDPCAIIRSKAAQKLGELQVASAAQALAQRCRDGDSRVRLRAVAALGELGGAGYAGVLSARLEQVAESDDVRMLAAEALGKLKASQGLPALCRALHDPDGYIRWKSAWALGQLGDGRGVHPLMAALQDKDSDVRREAARALGELGDPRALSALRLRLQDSDIFVRRWAEEALQRLGAPPPESGDSQPLQAAERLKREAEALGENGSAEAVPRLLQLLAGKDPEIRKVSAIALGKLKARNALPQLIRALQTDPDPDFQAALVIALGTLGDSAALPALLSKLTAPDSDIREEALNALARLAAPEALPYVQRSLRERGGYKLKKAAYLALAALSRPEAYRALAAALAREPDSALQLWGLKLLAREVPEEALTQLGQSLLAPDPLVGYAAGRALLSYPYSRLPAMQQRDLRRWLSGNDPLKRQMRSLQRNPGGQQALERNLAFIYTHLLKEEEWLRLRKMFNPVTQAQEEERLQAAYRAAGKYHPDDLWQWEFTPQPWD